MKEALVTMLSSKKFIAAIVAGAIYGAGVIFGVDKEMIEKIYTALLVYVGAQGFADNGKSAAQVGVPRAVLLGGTGQAAVLLLVVLLGAGAVLPQAGCATAGPAAATGITATLDCEAQHFDAQVLEDARILADAKVEQWLAGGPRPSSAKVRADLAPLRSNLARCAVVGAIAAVIALAGGAQPPEGASSLAGTVSPGPGLLAAFEEARVELGWGRVRLADGTVL